MTAGLGVVALVVAVCSACVKQHLLRIHRRVGRIEGLLAKGGW